MTRKGGRGTSNKKNKANQTNQTKRNHSLRHQARHELSSAALLALSHANPNAKKYRRPDKGRANVGIHGRTLPDNKGKRHERAMGAT